MLNIVKKHQNEEVEIFKVLRIWHMVARSVLPKKKKKNSQPYTLLLKPNSIEIIAKCTVNPLLIFFTA